MRQLFRAIGRLAQAPLSVLVTGETGPGKELVARALHRESPRARRPSVALNTAAIPAALLGTVLFGHEAGAFTAPTNRPIGRSEHADGGTLSMDARRGRKKGVIKSITRATLTREKKK